MYEVLLVDDHLSVMEGTRLLLEQEGDMRVTLASSAETALECCAAGHRFDVMLFDLHMPDMNGIDLAKTMIHQRPDAVILMYTGHDFSNQMNLMLETGIAGLISKASSREQLVTAVRCALRGEVVLPLSLFRQMRRVTGQSLESGQNNHAQGASLISEKEYHILKQIAGGKSNKEIAEKVIMSQRSLEYCLTHLFQKLKVKSRIEAAIKAKGLGLLSDGDFIAR
ncbi:response regulator transcription factor [Paenibacillus lemnae]|uniref:Response regulator transcription factor n=1 Tax=Paenibacillus lemnae TaxID=1330551 RepID=A0A848M4J7_PAELE|nr:response regulator transcription factor [Paenibacillus lemnae]NMO95179.1 response regulator transcription factor [Paenibacillus lemnae]